MHEDADDVLLKNKQTMSVVSQEEKSLKKKYLMSSRPRAQFCNLARPMAIVYRGPPPTICRPTDPKPVLMVWAAIVLYIQSPLVRIIVNLDIRRYISNVLRTAAVPCIQELPHEAFKQYKNNFVLFALYCPFLHIEGVLLQQHAFQICQQLRTPD
ncbi:hypothetical protein CEXT_453461 [Caerostris extrusa]|uniref:Uncharacterized protein n=1 Tax=Caerostris extrusa TaxID=172846 RepID=A0AAV4WFE6_CAEEX|nr:hypothetical protein CEXT_453461 [Caerostris extrusa]